MIRAFAVTAATFTRHHAGPGSIHPAGHGQGHPQVGPGHTRADSAQHAALHALVHGNWSGMFTSPKGVVGGLNLSVSRDSLRKLLVNMSIGQPTRAGLASNFVVDGATIRWTQDLSGARAGERGPERRRRDVRHDGGEAGL